MKKIKSKIDKIVDIGESYKNMLIKNKEIEAEAKRRKQICDLCEANSDNSNKSYPITICMDCGCLLKAKQRSKESQCPRNKW